MSEGKEVEDRPAKRARGNDGEAVCTVPVLRIKKLSEHAKTPERGTAKAAGYDLHSAHDYKVRFTTYFDNLTVITDCRARQRTSKD